MSEYTPTTDEVRERYSQDLNFLDRFEFSAELASDFDRWLAAHDAEVAASALEKAARRHFRESIKAGVGDPTAGSDWLLNLAAEKRGA